MNKLFGPDASVSQMLNRTADLVFLNLLFLLCCLPVLTIGAAVTALYDTAARMQRGEGKLYGGFFRAFFSHFLPATALWLLFLLPGALLGYSLYFYISAGMGGMVPVLGACLFVFAWTALVSWIFPLRAWVGCGVMQTVKYAAVCCVSHKKQTLTVTVLNLLPFLLFFFLPGLFRSMGIIWPFLYFSLIACFNQAVLRKHLNRLLPCEEEEEI